MTKRCIETIAWREVYWHRPFDLENVYEALTHLATLTPRGSVIWEARGCRGNVRHIIGADKKYIKRIEDVFKTYGTVQFYPLKHNTCSAVRYARKLHITKPSLSLNTDITSSVIRAGLAALAATPNGEETVIQVILGGAYSPTPVSRNIQNPHATWLDVVLGNVGEATTESRNSIKEKANQYCFQANIRIGTSGSVTEINNVLSSLRTLESAGVHITAESDKAADFNTAHIPWHFPLKLSVKELAGFLMLPAGEDELKGTEGLHPKLLTPPLWYYPPLNTALDRTFAKSIGNIIPQKLSISPQDSLEHTVILGPTGSGKSTAMEHLILSDINAGRSVLVIDPKADLVNDILERIPESRADDVVVIDPSEDSPVGFNPLAFKNYKRPELIADAILSVFQEIFADSWGVRTQDILSASLLTLAQTENSNLLWLPALLTDDEFRHKITDKLGDKIALKPFWNSYDSMTKAKREQEIAPVLNKIRQFLLRPSLRNVLGQSSPKFNLTDLFYKRKIVLVPLNKGLIGSESAKLLGSLIVGLTWVLALSRADIPKEKRHIVSLYIDELQDYLRLPSDFSDALAQARGLGVGITMAHQYRAQLTPEMRAGIDANARNKIIFGLNASDAKDMATQSPELSSVDFMSLPRYQIYTSFMVRGKNTGWIRGETLPPTPAIRTAADLRGKSMTTYGMPSSDIEQEYISMFSENQAEENTDTPIGRRKIK